MFKSIVTVALLLTSQVSFSAETAVSFQDAPKYYGQTKTVEGTIATTFCDDKRCFLNFDKDYKKYLSAVIEGDAVAAFTKATDAKAKTADLEKAFAGKKVQVTGAVTEYKSSKEPTKAGRPQIALTKAADIKLVK